MNNKLEARIARLEKILNKNEDFNGPDWKSAEEVLNRVMSEAYNFDQEIAGCGDRKLLDAAHKLHDAISVAFMELKKAQRRWVNHNSEFLD